LKIQILRDVSVVDRDGRNLPRKAGEVVSVYHAQGHRLITHRFALWVAREDSDPYWDPIPMYRAAIPQRDKMIHKAQTNKGGA
jgi:hypothetical protein